MDFALPQAYLLGLIVLLGVVAVVVGRQVLRVRRQEGQLASLERRCQDTTPMPPASTSWARFSSTSACSPKQPAASNAPPSSRPANRLRHGR